MNKNEIVTRNLNEAILEGIKKIKGKDITIIDLNTIKHTECGYFVICHGTSSTHVSSIAESVEKKMEEIAGEKALHTEGYNNALWILLDFGEIVVHVFDEKTRNFYDLESLWSDAKITKIDPEN
jgi:ribosome-associated protein